MRERITDMAAGAVLPLAVGTVLGLTGPFGTYDALTLLPRLAYWLAIVGATWLLAEITIRQTDAAVGARLPMPRLAVPLTGAVLAALPATGIVAMANALAGLGWPAHLPLLAGQVLLLLIAISVPVYRWQVLREQADAPAPATPPDAALFHARLSPPLPGALLCLEMQDHYLVVHGTAGSQMILCRMEDAARELAGLGRRVHRSWWVAADAVAGAEREGQRRFLRLTDGRRVPVGRSFQPELRAADWLG